MSKTQPVKRLFLLAGYDRDGHVDASLVWYVKKLSKYGDVVVHMDSDCPDGSIDALNPYAMHAAAARHGEYDFGSYKRAYIYARDAHIMQNYDFVYMLNDSVYGPLMDLGATLQKMESSTWDAFGLVYNPHREHPHIQSWFIGMRPDIFMAPWFDRFMTSITKLPSKGMITRQYEQGFSNLARENGARMGCLYTVKNRGVYNRVKYLYRRGMPFMKKVAFPRHNGAYGAQIRHILNRIDPTLRDAILENARRAYGDEYVTNMLRGGALQMTWRKIKYAIWKTFNKGQK